MKLKFQQLVLDNGYEMVSTFWNDFTIADAFGIEAIQDTYNRAFEEWKSNVIYVTELSIVLNHKIWQHYESKPNLGKLYDKLWWEVRDWCLDNLKDGDLTFFLDVTD